MWLVCTGASLHRLAVLSMRQGPGRGNTDQSFSQLGSLKLPRLSDTDMGKTELQQLQALLQLQPEPHMDQGHTVATCQLPDKSNDGECGDMLLFRPSL